MSRNTAAGTIRRLMRAPLDSPKEDTRTFFLWVPPQTPADGVILIVMRSWKRLALGVVLLGIATATVVPFARRGARSVRLLIDAPRSVSKSFDRRQSAALFVGVSRFTSDSIDEVQYAADDAVDLAYVFALERRVSLVLPRRVVLMLAGRPAKPQSRDRLRALRDAGVDVRSRASADDIRAALRDQAALAVFAFRGHDHLQHLRIFAQRSFDFALRQKPTSAIGFQTMQHR